MRLVEAGCCALRLLCRPPVPVKLYKQIHIFVDFKLIVEMVISGRNKVLIVPWLYLHVHNYLHKDS